MKSVLTDKFCKHFFMQQRVALQFFKLLYNKICKEEKHDRFNTGRNENNRLP